MKTKYVPERGDCIWVDFYTTSGHEQKGRRPAVVVSPKDYNERSGLALVCPVTSKIKTYPFEVAHNGKKITGAILSDQLKSIDWQSRGVAFVEKVANNTFKELQEKIILLISG